MNQLYTSTTIIQPRLPKVSKTPITIRSEIMSLLHSVPTSSKSPETLRGIFTELERIIKPPVGGVAQSDGNLSPIPTLDYFVIDEWMVHDYWDIVFYSHLGSIVSKDSAIYTSDDTGLVYYFVIDGQVRYIGQTREMSLNMRMIKRQPGGMVGYPLSTKRHVLQAVSRGRFLIVTKTVPLLELDSFEQAEINKYGPTNRLFNIRDNHHFESDNFLPEQVDHPSDVINSSRPLI